MAKKTTPPAGPEPEPTPIQTAEDFPIIESLALHKSAKGWCVILIRTQARVVIDEEILSDGAMPRDAAMNVFKVECAKRLFFPESFRR